jgi:SAM-dependent methyltransferase
VVVERMLELADVKAGDVVYDLACGDGRIVIAAVKRPGVRGVCVDINPVRIQESRTNARKEGVDGRIRFVERDLFKVPLGEATVVTLYLLPEVNVRLRPRLRAQLRKGARVVSHDFDMGDWRPDRSRRVHGPHREHRLYLWVIPARVAGMWRMRLGGGEALLNLAQRYQVVGGTLSLDGREHAITGGRLAGDRITFTAGPMVFEGLATADELQGRAGEAAWTARRVR